MNCIITLKIYDHFPKLESIPYKNFICLFNYKDFIGKIPLSEYYYNECSHEINKINSDIKYTIHILESNSSSLIGMSELLIPFIKFKQINPPCRIIQEQKIKVIIDLNTKRKLFKTLINSSDIFLVLRAEIFVPNVKNIGKMELNKIEVKRKNINFNSNNKDNSPRAIRKQKLNNIKSNKEMIKNDFFNYSNNKNNKTINYDNKNNNILSNKTKLMNDIKNSFKKIDEINLSSKGIKKSKLSQKRSPKKRVTILELMEQKMQPLLLNTNNEEINNLNSSKKINIKINKSGKKITSPKSKNEVKKDNNTIEKHPSKKHCSSKNSNEFTSSNNKNIRRSVKGLYNQISQQMDDINNDINVNLYNNKFNKDKISYDQIKINKSKEPSYFENDEINSNYGILSTDDRTEQVLSEIDKKILEKSSKLRNILEEQIKNLNNHKKYPGTLYIKEKGKINKEMELQDNNLAINKSPLGTIYNNSILLSQEKIKNNYLSLLDLYHLLSQKLSKIISENVFSTRKLNILKEEYKSDKKKIEIIKKTKNNIEFDSFYNNNLKNSLKPKIMEQLIYTKNLESKLYQTIFDIDVNDYEIIRQKEIERVNKLNEERKLNLLLKLIKAVVFDIGNISQIFKNDIYKQNCLKQILENNDIKEKEPGTDDFINLCILGIKNKYNLGSDNLDNIIKEVDEEKEEESEIYSSNKKKNHDSLSKNMLDEKKEYSNDMIELKDENIFLNNINDNNNQTEEQNKIDNNLSANHDIKEENDENKKIEIMKDILINKFKQDKKFEYLEKNEFLFDNKYKIKATLLDNNEISIEIDNNKYNLETFISSFCKKENTNIVNDINKNDKKTFVYTKKIMPQNEHKKRRRKKRITDDSEEENQNNEDNKEK